MYVCIYTITDQDCIVNGVWGLLGWVTISTPADWATWSGGQGGQGSTDETHILGRGH